MNYFIDENEQVLAYDNDELSKVDVSSLTEITEQQAIQRSSKTTLHLQQNVEDVILLSNQQIDSTAELARLKYITNGVGQSMVYQEKLEEALDFATAGYPEDQLADYPFVGVEAEIQQISGKDAADQILSNSNLWRQKGVQIEKTRRTGKIALSSQTNAEVVIELTKQILNELNNI